MIDETAAEYAKENSGDADMLKVYEAYKDGYTHGASKIVGGDWGFIFLGVILTILLLAAIHLFIKPVFIIYP